MNREQKLVMARKYFRNHEMSRLRWASKAGLELSKVVVQIPARAGSTRVPGKNAMDFCGKPLLAWTAMIATRLRGVDRVIVNTNSSRYAAIGERYGLEAPFLRPDELAASDSSLSAATHYLIRHLMDEDYPVKSVITLMPTSPFRNLARIQRAVDLLAEHGAAYTALRVTSLDRAYSDGEGEVVLRPGRTLREHVCCKTLGTFSGEYIVRKHIAGYAVQYVTNPVELLDIDTPRDVELARYVLENGLYDFGVDHARVH